jgi:DNA-binding response OmpR family regulator
MDATAMSVLIVSTEPATWSHAVPFFKRSHIGLQTASDGAGALTRIASNEYALVIIQYPLPDLALDELLAAITINGTGQRRAATLVLASRDDAGSVRKHLGNGVDRLVNLDWVDSEIQPAIAALLQLQTRREHRTRLSLEVALVVDGKQVCCQTVDLSRSGMQAQGQHEIEVGERVRFEMRLPDGESAVCGEAEIVRHINDQDTRPRGRGFGARFVSFDDESQQHLNQLLATHKR